MQLVWQSFGEAWAALKRNWVIVWFPALVGLGIIIALVIVFLVLVIGSGAGQGLQRLQAGDLNAYLGLFKAFGVFAVIAFLSMMALVAGQSYLQAEASAGKQVTTQDFGVGVRRYYWRVLGGNVLVAAVSVVFTVIFFGGMLRDWWQYALQQGATGEAGSILPWIFHTMPMALAGFLLLAVAGLFISMWTKLLLVDDIGTIPAMLGSVRLVASKFGTFLLLAIISWAATLVIQRIGEGQVVFSLLMTVVNLIWTAYYQLTLFTYYRHLSGAGLNPPENPVQL